MTVVEHAQALLGDLDRHRHKVVRAKDVESAQRSAGVWHLVDAAHAAPGALTVGAACSEAARDASLAVAAVVRVAAGRVLRIEPQREESGASPPHCQARHSTAGMGALGGGESCSTVVRAGSVEGRVLDQRLTGDEGSGCEGSKRAQSGGGGGVWGEEVQGCPHLAKEIARESATPLSSTCIPRGTAAKLTENPSPPVPRPTSSSKLRRRAALAKELVRGGGTTSVPMFSKLAEPGVPTSCAPGRVRCTRSP